MAARPVDVVTCRPAVCRISSPDDSALRRAQVGCVTVAEIIPHKIYLGQGTYVIFVII